MSRITISIVAAGALGGLVFYLGPTSGQADQEAYPQGIPELAIDLRQPPRRR